MNNIIRFLIAVFLVGCFMGILTMLITADVASAKVVEVPDVLSVVESIVLPNYQGYMHKVYDRNNEVVCYIYFRSGQGSSISCVK